MLDFTTTTNQNALGRFLSQASPILAQKCNLLFRAFPAATDHRVELFDVFQHYSKSRIRNFQSEMCLISKATSKELAR